MDILYILLGLALLVGGGQLLVVGASGFARALRVPPLIIGLTVVAYGTSAPELAVSLQAASGGTAGVALGNVLGSNICNVLLILGLAAVFRHLVVERQLVRIDVPVMILVSCAALAMAVDGSISRLDGLLLLAGAVAYTALQIRLGSRSREEEPAEGGGEGAAVPRGAKAMAGFAVSMAAGLALLVFGADRLVEGAVGLARAAGVSDLVIGLTVVAVGTSMPEVAATVVAALRREASMAVGNVVGSNVFNILAVLGGTSVLAPGGVEVSLTALTFDFPIMVAVAIACLPIFTTGHRIERWEGAFFLLYYAAYVGYLVLDATQHHLVNEFRAAFWFFVLPLTVVTLAVSLYRHFKERAALRRA
jgi:cation:H+ antiporter